MKTLKQRLDALEKTLQGRVSSYSVEDRMGSLTDARVQTARKDAYQESLELLRKARGILHGRVKGELTRVEAEQLRAELDEYLGGP